MIGLLYPVCAKAQAVAAVEACEQALAVKPNPSLCRAREMLVWMETAREQLRSILAEWPRLAAMEFDPARASALGGLMPAVKKSLFGASDPFSPKVLIHPPGQDLGQVIEGLDAVLERLVFGEPPSAWLKRLDDEGLDDWVQQRGTLGAVCLNEIQRRGWGRVGDLSPRHLPELTEAGLHARLAGPAADAFICQPDWDGIPRETTGLSRIRHLAPMPTLVKTWGNGLFSRLAARLVELAAIPARLRHMAEGLEPGPVRLDPRAETGVGLAQVEAARGRLIHRVEIQDGRIADYRILAPTEWNFHPKGVVAEMLLSLPPGKPEQRRRQAEWLVQAVDPCVGYELRIE